MSRGYTPSLKQIYRQIVKETIKEINSDYIPNTISLFQSNFIANISINEHFTLEERQSIALYFQSNNVLTEEKILEFNGGLLNEALKDVFLKGIEKVKNVFGNIKDFVTKIWASVKKWFIETGTKFYNFAKSKVSALKPKIQDALKKATDKAALIKELLHIKEVAAWFKSVKDGGVLNKFTEKVVSGEEQALKENIFTKEFTALLCEAEMGSIPVDITSKETTSAWEKMNIPWKTIFTVIQWATNPVLKYVTNVVKALGPKVLNGISKAVEYLGGPGAITYTILPGILAEVGELFHVFEGAASLGKEALGLIPGIGPYLETIMHIAEVVFIGMAIYGVIEEVAIGLGLIKGAH